MGVSQLLTQAAFDVQKGCSCLCRHRPLPLPPPVQSCISTQRPAAPPVQLYTPSSTRFGSSTAIPLPLLATQTLVCRPKTPSPR